MDSSVAVEYYLNGSKNIDSENTYNFPIPVRWHIERLYNEITIIK